MYPSSFTITQPLLCTLIGVGFLLLHAGAAQAADLPFSNTSEFATASALLSDNVTKPIVTTLGLVTAPRAYDSASPLYTSGVELGLSISLVHLPDSLSTALKTAGVKSTPPRSLPFPVLFVRKGMGRRFTLGASALYYKGYRVIGGDAKVTLWNPEEGMTVAARLGASFGTLGFVSTKVWYPQLIVSRKMSFADPYLGVGYTAISGQIEVSLLGYTFTSKASNGGFSAFTGVKLKSDLINSLLIVEGSYSSLGGSALGVALGISIGGEQPKEPERAPQTPPGAT